MWDHMNGYFGGFGMLLFWVLIIVVVVVMVRGLGGVGGSGDRGDTRPPPDKDALEILKERYARGEIDEETYERMRREIGH